MKLNAYFYPLLTLTVIALMGLSASAHAAGWPRQIADSFGVHTLNEAPQRIVSTSVTLTGSLLAIDAPVVASGATTPGNRVADDQGFLRQWSAVARQKQLQRLYIGEPNAEAIAAQLPDLILVSATGGDSAMAIYDKLSAIAPTLVINYDSQSWQQVLLTLGQITGREQQAQRRIAQFDRQLTALKQKITLPPQPSTALVYSPASRSANIWTPSSAQGQLLAQLGFTQAPIPDSAASSHSMGKRHDIIQSGGENLAAALNGQSLFLFAGTEQDKQALEQNPLLAHLPAVKNHRVYALGDETFRLDYYSATLVLARLQALFVPAAP